MTFTSVGSIAMTIISVGDGVVGGLQPSLVGQKSATLG